MAQPKTKHKTGDHVFVPSDLLPEGADYPHAMYGTEVVRVQGDSARRRSLKVRQRDGSTSDWIASSRVSVDPSVLLLRIGDYCATSNTEPTLLDPLAKSGLQFLRLLLDDDMVQRRDVRSLAELRVLWKRESGAFRNVILVGHGAKDGIVFGVDGLVDAGTLCKALADDGKKKIFLSLCCKTGYAEFAKPFSAERACDELIAPYHSVHGAVASQFLQALFVCRLYRGESRKVSFRHANERIPAGQRFRRWVGGTLVN